VLISSDLAKRLDLSGEIKAEYLGQHALKGRGQSLGVMALNREKQHALKLVAKRA
jgi:adenylate cyclase